MSRLRHAKNDRAVGHPTFIGANYRVDHASNLEKHDVINLRIAIIGFQLFAIGSRLEGEQQVPNEIHVALHILPNVKDEPRSRLARAVLLGAQIVTAVIVGSGALFGLLRRRAFDARDFQVTVVMKPDF
jgi:hypothetical protein